MVYDPVEDFWPEPEPRPEDLAPQQYDQVVEIDVQAATDADLLEVMNSPSHPQSDAALTEYLAREREREEAARAAEAETIPGTDSTVDKHSLEYRATTQYPLSVFNRLDYISKCKHCESRPFSEGPHHDRDCPRYASQLRLSTDNALRKYCKHCDARPFVAGFHHKNGCERGFDAKADWSVVDDSYSTPCKCGSKPYSEGPHHSTDCEYYTSDPQFRTERAHSAECGNCGARPFPPGPHHNESCQRHVNVTPIPLDLTDAT